MAKFKRMLSSKELAELKPYIKYLKSDRAINEDEFLSTLEQLVRGRYIFRTPTIRHIAAKFMAETGRQKLPKCLVL